MSTFDPAQPDNLYQPVLGTTRLNRHSCIGAARLSAIILGVMIACNALPAASANEPSRDIAGSWHGIYYALPNIMEFEMSVTLSGSVGQDNLTGTIRYFPSSAAKPITVAQSSGEYAFAGRCEEEINFVKIRATEWKKSPQGGHRTTPPPLVGVYDPASDTLAGIFHVPENRGHGRDQFFVCVRSSKKEELHEFIRRISGVAAKEAQLEEKQQRQDDARKDREEQQATWRTFVSLRPQINAANGKVATQERAIAATERSIAAREREIARLDGLIAAGGRNLTGNQRNRDRKTKQLAELQQKLAEQTAELGSARQERDALLAKIEHEHPEVKEHLAEKFSKPERSSKPAPPEKRRREPPTDRQAKQKQEAGDAQEMLESVVAWASKLSSEFPDRELERHAFTPEDARNLFLDEHFRDHFGETYLEMDDDALAAVRNVFSGRFGRNAELDPYRGLSQSFTRRLPQNNELHVYLRAQPVIAVGLQLMQDRLKQLTVQRDVFEAIATTETTMEPFLQVFWPRERATVIETVAATRARLADPVLAMKTDELLARAKGYADAVSLSQWRQNGPEEFRYASADARNTQSARVVAKLNEIVAPLLDAEIKKIENFGPGRPGLEAGSEWYKNFTARYAFASHHARYQDCVRLLAEQRQRELPRAQNEIVKEIASSNDADSVDALSLALLNVPGDRSTEAGQMILTAAEQRLARLETAKLFSDYEMSLMKDGVVTVPSGLHAPTAEEIGLAVLREISSVAGGRLLDRSTARITSLLGSLLNLYGRVSVHDLEKLDWRSSNRHQVTLHEDAQDLAKKLSEGEAAGTTAIRSGADSFWCIYKVKVRFAYDDTPNLLGVDMNTKEHQILLDLMNSGGAEVVVDEFQLKDSGWRSPTARKRMLDKQAATAREAGADADSRCFTCGGVTWLPGRGGPQFCPSCGGTGRR